MHTSSSTPSPRRAAPLLYLCKSTLETPEVALYTDSDKVGVLSGDPAPMRLRFKRSAAGSTATDHFDGEASE